MKKILLVGSIGAQNLGDTLLLERIADVYKNNDVYSLTSQATGISFVKGMAPFPFGFRSFFSFRWVKTCFELYGIDKIVFIGGGLWDDHDGPLGPLMWTFYLMIFRFYKKPIILMGQSFSIKRAWLCRVLPFCLRNSGLWYFRERASLERFKEMTGSDEAFEGVDSVFLKRFWSDEPAHKSWQGPVTTFFVNIHCSFGLKRAKVLLDRFHGKEIILISTDIKDIHFYREYFPGYESFLLRSENDLKKLKINSAILAMRLHLAILTLDLPQLILPYSTKVADFFPKQFIKNIEDVNPESIKQDSFDLWQDKQEFLEENYKKALAVLKEIDV